jgi:hypothetical protein
VVGRAAGRAERRERTVKESPALGIGLEGLPRMRSVTAS